MKKGFYYINSKWFERCYYISGTNTGNRWIDIRTVDTGLSVKLSNPKWVDLYWMYIPPVPELKKMIYSKDNPTKIND